MHSLKTVTKRALASVLAAALLLTVFPFMGIAVDAAPEYIEFGAYEQDGDTTNGKEPIRWLVLETLDNGSDDVSKVLISQKVLDAKQFHTAVGKTWVDSSLRSWLNGAFLSDAFTTAEQAYLQNRTFSYISGATGSTPASQTTSDDTCKVSLLGKTTFASYFTSTAVYYADRIAETTAAATAAGLTDSSWWLCDVWTSTQAAFKMKQAGYVKSDGSVGGKTNSSGKPLTTVLGVRPVIVVKDLPMATFTETDNVSFTYTDGVAAKAMNAFAGASFKVVLDANYSESDIVVSFTPKNGTAQTLTANTEEVYTIPASSVGGVITVTGVVANPGDFTEYDDAVAAAGTLPYQASYYTEASYKALTDLLAVDISGYTAAQQDDIDTQTLAIETAVTNLVLRDADYTAFNTAYDNAVARRDDSNYVQSGANYNALRICINGAAAKRGKKINEQADINAYTQAMIDATNAMELKHASTAEWKNATSSATATKPAAFYSNFNVITDLLATLYTEQELGAPDAEKNLTDQLVVLTNAYTELYITEQATVDSATQRLNAAVSQLTLKSADYAALDASIATASAYTEDQYVVDTEAGKQAWDSFVIQLDNAKKVSRELKADEQATVDDADAALQAAMLSLQDFIKLTKFEQWCKETKQKLQEFVEILKIVRKVLKVAIPMLFRGEIPIKDLINGDADWEALLQELLARI